MLIERHFINLYVSGLRITSILDLEIFILLFHTQAIALLLYTRSVIRPEASYMLPSIVFAYQYLIASLMMRPLSRGYRKDWCIVDLAIGEEAARNPV